MVDDADILVRNGVSYSKSHSLARDVLAMVDGTKSYREIAKDLGIPPTTASGLLAKAEKLGLAYKVSGRYKRISGAMGYIPRNSIKHVSVSQKSRNFVKIVKKSVNSTAKMLRSSPSYSPSSKSITQMTEAYAWLYMTENSLRNFIRKVLGQTATWWKSNCPSDVQRAVQEEIQKAPYNGAKRNDELEFTHLGQLKNIIINGKNWNLFKPHLHEHDKENFRVTIDKAVPTRNSVGHCIPLQGIDHRECEVRFNDILRMLK